MGHKDATERPASITVVGLPNEILLQICWNLNLHNLTQLARCKRLHMAATEVLYKKDIMLAQDADAARQIEPGSWDRDWDIRLAVGGPTAISWGIMRNEVGPVKQSLEYGSRGVIDKRWLSAYDRSSETFLAAAVSCERDDIVALLLEYGADIEARCSKGVTPLIRAMRVRSFEQSTACMERLVKAGANVNAIAPDGTTPLMACLCYGQFEYLPRKDWRSCVDTLVSAGADLDKLGGDGYSLLARAALKGYSQRMGKLLDLGADPLAGEHLGRGAWNAVATGVCMRGIESTIACLQELIQHGVPVDAARFGQLLRHDANPKILDFAFAHVAEGFGDKPWLLYDTTIDEGLGTAETLGWLLRNFPPPSEPQNSQGDTGDAWVSCIIDLLLSEAAADTELVDRLCDTHIDPSWRDEDGSDMLMTLLGNEDFDDVASMKLFRHLKGFGFDAEFQNSLGWTYLHTAATNRGMSHSALEQVALELRQEGPEGLVSVVRPNAAGDRPLDMIDRYHTGDDAAARKRILLDVFAKKE